MQQHFTGRTRRADNVQTSVTPTARLREVKTFGLILYLAQSIKQALLPLTPPTTSGNIEQEENELLWEKKQKTQQNTAATEVQSTITGCKDRRRHTMIIEPMRGDYRPFDNLAEYFLPRLNSPDRLQGQINGGGNRRCKDGAGGEKMAIDLGVYWSGLEK